MGPIVHIQSCEVTPPRARSPPDTTHADRIDNMSNCQADEQEEALDQLASCQDVACNEFNGCAIDAGLTCYFGL